MAIGTRKYTKLLKKEPIGVCAICFGRRSVLNTNILHRHDGITRSFLSEFFKEVSG